MSMDIPTIQGMDKYIGKADALIEAMPYIARFKNEMIVVKLGGSVMESEENLRSTLTDIAFMRTVGMYPVVVHGGGKTISRALNESGIETKFVQGLRVTDAESMHIVEDVIKNKVNAQVVSILNEKGVSASPLHGERIFFALKKTGKDPATGADLDWGYVGVPMAVDTGPVRELLHEDQRTRLLQLLLSRYATEATEEELLHRKSRFLVDFVAHKKASKKIKVKSKSTLKTCYNSTSK